MKNYIYKLQIVKYEETNSKNEEEILYCEKVNLEEKEGLHTKREIVERMLEYAQAVLDSEED